MAALALMPWAVRFYRDYSRRPPGERHPVSLAIVSTLLLLIFHALSTFAVKDYGWQPIRAAMLVGELVVALHYGIAFRIGRDRPDRGAYGAPSPNGDLR